MEKNVKEEIIEETEEVEEETKKIEEENEKVEANEKEAKDFLDEKPKKSVFKIIFNVVFWLVILVLLFTWGMDYMNVRSNKKPSFCISNKTHKFDDGNVLECTGLGYKVYTYNRSSMENGTEFVPFFMGMRKSSK